MKPPFRRPSLYLSLAATALVAGWVLVGMSLHFCDETQRVMDGVLVWALLGIGLMGNVYAFVLAGMARAPRIVANAETRRGRVIIHGRTKWLDETSGWDPVDPSGVTPSNDSALHSQTVRPEMAHFQTTARQTLPITAPIKTPMTAGPTMAGRTADPREPQGQNPQGQNSQSQSLQGRTEGRKKENEPRDAVRHRA
jgi:hypothetical protein